jgi:GNAT superfamily N-acetyltransferase
MMEVRRAGPDDLAAVREIAEGYGNLVEWPRRPDYLDHELERGALWVALDGSVVAGFAGVLVDGDVAHLADAFVRPDRLGRGVGGALLAAALPRDRTLVTFASGDPRALPLYVRAGMRPLAPLLYLTGSIQAARDVARVVPGDLVAADAAASGRARPAALGLLSRAGAYGLTAGDGYAVVRPMDGEARIGPAAGSAAAVLALAAAASAEHGTVHLAIPGPHPALPALLAGGFRVSDSVDTYMTSRPGVQDLGRYLPDPDLG